MTVSPLAPREGERLVSGWGRTSPTVARIVPVSSVSDVQREVRSAGPRGILARGLGRSYGDAAQSGGATLLDLSAMDGATLDAEAGTVTAGAGASLDALLRTLVPAGFFVPVTPGTRMVTVGGAIAADIHGKNHHVEGTFGSHVTSMTVVDGTGEVRVLTPADPGFWAVVGGMGLAGVITEATFDLIRVESPLMSVDTDRLPDLDAVMAAMVAGDDQYRYSVAWIDSLATSGRGVLTRGDHASADAAAGRPADYDPQPRLRAPRIVPGGLLSPLTVRAFNEAWFRKAPRHRVGELQSIPAFFHPLDGVLDWNRVYGPGGFLQYQFVVPDAAGDLVAVALERLRAIGAPSFLTVLKRFGPSNPAPLSFPAPGWTLALDVPARIEGLDRVLDELDALVLAAGGRLYLAKDSRMSPQMMAASYPRLPQWRAQRADLDPAGVFTSDLARRLSL